jgi:DNA-binding transcriptional regulator YiaG
MKMNNLIRDIKNMTSQLIDTNEELEKRLEAQKSDFVAKLKHLINTLEDPESNDAEINIAKYLVQSCGLSQSKVARLSGTSQPHVSLWVRNKAPIPVHVSARLETVKRKIEAGEITFDELLVA